MLSTDGTEGSGGSRTIRLFTTLFAASLILAVPFTSAKIEIQQPNIQHAILDQYNSNDYLVVVPGFIDCSSTCPITLSKWKKLYTDNKPFQNQPFQLLFLNIDNISQKHEIESYIHAFDKSFIALDVNAEQRTRLYKDLGFWPQGNTWSTNIAHQPTSFLLKNVSGWEVMKRISTEELMLADGWEDFVNAQ